MFIMHYFLQIKNKLIRKKYTGYIFLMKVCD